MKQVSRYLISTAIISLSLNIIAPVWSNSVKTKIEVDRRDLDNQKKFTEVMQEVLKSNLSSRSLDEIIQQVAKKFVGAEYQSGLLDRTERETLVITFDRFDCFIFIETVLAIARNIASQDYDYQNFKKNIINQRYKNGNLDGYCSRLHYFSDWIDSNENQKNLKNITADLGGLKLDKDLNFMSNHRDRYPKMLENDANYDCILEMEAQLDRLDIYYIPTKNIEKIYSKLQSGDVIGVATNISGLDVTHTGFVYSHNDRKVGFIHASPMAKVTISPDLFQYIIGVQNAIGIIVARPTLE